MPLNLAGLCCWKAASQFGTAISIGPQKGLRRAFFLFFYGINGCCMVVFTVHLPYLVRTIVAPCFL